MATSTLGSGTLVLAGTTSGTTTVTATAVAGTTTLTLPAATDTLVGKATTDTLTNKTLTSPTLTGVATFAAGTDAAPAITTTGDTNTGIFFPAADTIAFTEGGAESMRIDSSGNLLVNCTSTPSNTVSGIRFVNPTSDTSRFSSGTVTTSTSHIQFLNGNGVVGDISTNGSATTFATSSDYRLKNTIAPMTGALAKVALLKPCTYKWNADGSNGQGFIAHELQEVVEGCVTGAKDAVDADGNPKYQGVDTSFLVATLTAAIQEQQALITQLTARITALEGA